MTEPLLDISSQDEDLASDAPLDLHTVSFQQTEPVERTETSLPEQYDADRDGLHHQVTAEDLASLLTTFDQFRGRNDFFKDWDSRALFLIKCLEATDNMLVLCDVPNVKRSAPIYRGQYHLDSDFAAPLEYMLPVREFASDIRSKIASGGVSEPQLDKVIQYLANSLLNVSGLPLTQTNVQRRYIDSAMFSHMGLEPDAYIENMDGRYLPSSLTWAVLSGLTSPEFWSDYFTSLEEGLSSKIARFELEDKSHIMRAEHSHLPQEELARSYPISQISPSLSLTPLEKQIGNQLLGDSKRGIETLFCAIDPSEELFSRLKEIYLEIDEIKSSRA